MEYYEIRDFDLAGRIAKIRTKKGVIETPYLFPVIDPIRQEITLDDIRKIGFNAIITNAYLLYRRKKSLVKDIHEIMKWDNVIMTDSGGYQVLEYGDIEVTNKTIVEYEKKINVDIGVILDIPTGGHMDWNRAREAVEETFRRACEALPLIQDTDILWVLPVQGAPYKDLLLRSCIRAWRYNYHIYALGSPTVLLEKYEYSTLIELVALARMILPPNKPLHVFGVGHPMIIPFLVALGADLFDSASYVLYARDNRYMVEEGTKRLEEIEYFPCSCPVCSKFEPKELLEMPSSERVKYLALHNVFMLRREINRVKQAIREGRLWELIEYRSKAHPSLKSAFNVLKKYVGFMEKYTPFSKGTSLALLLYDRESLYNPKIRIFRERAKAYSEKRSNKLLLIPAVNKPYRQQDFLKDFDVLYKDYDIMFYNPFLGLIPWGASDSYPVFQHEEPKIISDKELCRELAREIMDYVNRAKYKETVIVIKENVEWSKCLMNLIDKRLIKIITCT